MNLSATTLTLMRHSAGAVIAAATLSGEACAAGVNVAPGTASAAFAAPSMFDSGMGTRIAEEPKKPKEEKKKEEQRDPCGPCGMG